MDQAERVAELVRDHDPERGRIGDPAAGDLDRRDAETLLQLVEAAEPPVRLPLGTDTLKRIADKNAFVEKETESWRAVAVSTDFE